MTHLRSKLEMSMDVLRIVKNETSSPYHIMYQATLSWQTLQRILRPLESHGLVKETDVEDSSGERKKKCYEITQKGENVVKYFKSGKDPLEIEEISKISW